MRFRDRIISFMAGRNGNDKFNMFLLVSALVCLILGRIIGSAAGGLLSYAALALLIYSYFRMLSRNLYKRRKENDKYLKLRYSVTSYFKLQKERWAQRKEYKFFSCPSCRATLRVPRGRGKIKIVCRKCGTSFIGKS